MENKLTWLRVLAVVLGLSLMIGELWRSWGAGRELVFVLDDQILGALLVSSAWLMGRPSVRRRAYFSGAWAFASGMLYGSFFGKVLDPSETNPGNWDLGVLTILVGVAFFTASAGFIASVLAPWRGTT